MTFAVFPAMVAFGISALAAEIPAELPHPDSKEADQSKPVKVYILLGQSNMLGFGRIDPEEQKGTLSHLVEKEKKYPHLIDEAGNRSLGWDLLPPGSERFEYGGKTYAGYKDNPDSWVEGEPKKEVNWYAGRQYDADTGHAKEVLKNLGKYYPGDEEQGCEVAGFVWWQGHKDQNPAHAGRYEQNLVHLIKTLRKDFEVPEAKFALATIAFGGDELSGSGLTNAEAQLAVDGDTGKCPEFKGNVKTVEARPFWRDEDVSPSAAGYHYNHNAGTYMLVGDALGRAMAELLTK